MRIWLITIWYAFSIDSGEILNADFLFALIEESPPVQFRDFILFLPKDSLYGSSLASYPVDGMIKKQLPMQSNF